MSIQFPCPHCSEIMTVPDRFAGAQRVCPNCQGPITTPQPSAQNHLNPGSPAHSSAGTDHNQSRGPAAGDGDERRVRTSKAALFAFLCGLASLPLFFMALPGLFMGLIGRYKVRRSDGRLRGAGLAWGGILLSLVSLIVYSTFALTAGRQVWQTVQYAHGRFVTSQRMSQLHEGMRAALVRDPVLPRTLKTVASRGKLPPEAARPAIGEVEFVYLGAGRTESAMNGETVLLYWPLLDQKGEVISLFGDGTVKAVAPAELQLLLQQQGEHMEALQPNDLLPEQLLKLIRESKQQTTAGPGGSWPIKARG